MKENQTNHYFVEAWDAAMKNFFRQKTKRTLNACCPSLDYISVENFSPYNPLRVVREPMPEFLKEWMEQNPNPNIHRDKFIVVLAKRVEALEAALAEKGGKL